MKRADFGSHITIDNRGERIRLFVPPNPPVSRDLSPNANERNAVSNAIFSLGRLDGTAEISSFGQKLWKLTKIREIASSLSLEGHRVDISSVFQGETASLAGPPIDNLFAKWLSSFELTFDEIRGNHRDNLDFWSRIRPGFEELPDETEAKRVLGKGSSGLNAVPPPKELALNGLRQLSDHLFRNRLQLEAMDSAGIFLGMMLMLNPFGTDTGPLARNIALALLHREGLMNHSVVSLSHVIAQQRHRLNESLSLLRNNGDWEAWIAGFSTLVSEAADETSRFNQEIVRIYFEDRESASKLGRPADSILKLLDVIYDHPVFTSNFLVAKTKITPATVNKSLRHMEELSIIREATSRKRDRVFEHPRLLGTIDPGT